MDGKKGKNRKNIKRQKGKESEKEDMKTALLPFAGIHYNPFGDVPLFKPRPNRYFLEDDYLENHIPDDQLNQTMSPAERAENLKAMRKLKNSDLPGLRTRRDYAGWAEVNRELDRRRSMDPWFAVNERLREAIQLGMEETQVQSLKDLAQRLGGPPPGIEVCADRGYAAYNEVFGIPISLMRSKEALLEMKQQEQTARRARRMAAEYRKNMRLKKQKEEECPPAERLAKEARVRRERFNRRMVQQIARKREQEWEDAEKKYGKIDMDSLEDPSERIQRLIQEAKNELRQMRGLDVKLKHDADSSGMLSSDGNSTLEPIAEVSPGGRPRYKGDRDVMRAEIDSETIVESCSSATTGPIQVDVNSSYNAEQSDPPMRKHCFHYSIRITNHHPTDTIQLLGRRFEIQTLGSEMKDVVEGKGVTGRTPVVGPGEVFQYNSTAPLFVRPLGKAIIAARMRGEYRYCKLETGQETATEEQMKNATKTAELATFHFIFPEDQRVKPFYPEDDEDDDDEYDEDTDYSDVENRLRLNSKEDSAFAEKVPGDEDISLGKLSEPANDVSEVVTQGIRVAVSTSYRPDRSDEKQDKHCFAYNIRITNEADQVIQLVSRRFEIQTIGSNHKNIVQGPGVTGRQPILKPGETFEYTSTAPLSVKPILDETSVVARMQGEYRFLTLGADGKTPISTTPHRAKLGKFHFILPVAS